jgi:hypothetical protein
MRDDACSRVAAGMARGEDGSTDGVAVRVNSSNSGSGMLTGVDLPDDDEFRDALHGLKNGDFSRLLPLFEGTGDTVPRIVAWVEQRRFQNQEKELAEALTCACFNGNVDVAEYLLEHGVPPSGGSDTGLNAIHWAANRGQLEAVRLLLRHNVPLETRSMYHGTALGTAVHAAIYETRTADHLVIIGELIDAGARIAEAGFPTGNESVDSVLRHYGAT